MGMACVIGGRGGGGREVGKQMKKVGTFFCVFCCCFFFCCLFVFSLNARRHRGILGAAGHIIMTPANQVLVMGQIIRSLSDLGKKSSQR
jgi:hypothetical protein